MAKTKSRVRLTALQEQVLKDYFTLDEATQTVQRMFPGWQFSKRQVARAVDSGKLPVENLGRLRYIHASELAKFINRLVPTGTMPNKLRYSGYMDTSLSVLGQQGKLLPEDGRTLLQDRQDRIDKEEYDEAEREAGWLPGELTQDDGAQAPNEEGQPLPASDPGDPVKEKPKRAKAQAKTGAKKAKAPAKSRKRAKQPEKTEQAEQEPREPVPF